MIEHKCELINDEELLSSAIRAMVVVSITLFKAGYFMGLLKYSLIPEKVMTYLGIDRDGLRGRFAVPVESVAKYFPLLEETKGKKAISYTEMEQLLGKLVSLECSVPAGTRYVREKYSAMRESGVAADSKKVRKIKYLFKLASKYVHYNQVFVLSEVITTDYPFPADPQILQIGTGPRTC